jgi:hypothetical protein
MEIVLGMYRLANPGGSEHYTLTVADQLQRLGHGVTIFVEEENGPMADLARKRGLRLTTAVEQLPDHADALYAQESITAYRLAARYANAPLAYAVHSAAYDLSIPPQIPGLVSAFVCLYTRAEERARAVAVKAEVVRLRHPVDTQRFLPRGSLREPPRRVLVLGNYLSGDRARVIDEACSEAGIEVAHVGVHHGNQVLEADALINDADIVVGKARVIVEAMACGRAAYVYDAFGSGGWVTPESYPRFEPDSFSGHTTTRVIDRAGFRQDLDLYRPEMGAVNRELAFINHSAQRHAIELVELFERLGPRRPQPSPPLDELARLVRVQWQTEQRALGLAGEAAQLRDDWNRLQKRAHELEAYEAEVLRLQGVVRELDAKARRTNEQLEDVLSQRRVRFGLALARPLDFVRRLFR